MTANVGWCRKVGMHSMMITMIDEFDEERCCQYCRERMLEDASVNNRLRAKCELAYRR
jgi:hypothetical protein